MRAFLANEKGGSAAEFALVLPALLAFLFGIIDAGRFIWTVNRAEKASQVGVRRAVVTDLVASGLGSYSFALDASPALEPGAPITTAQFGSVRCTTTTTAANATCSCLATPCPGTTGTAVNTNSFGAIYNRMRDMMGELQPKNVRITYSNVGLGYAGNPYGSDVSPLVTVEVTGVRFQPLTTIIFGVTFNLPNVHSSMTLEDGTGTVSN